MRAVVELESIGFTFSLTSAGGLRYRYTGGDRPPDRAKVLLQELRDRKEEAIRYLTSRQHPAGAADGETGPVVRPLSTLPPATAALCYRCYRALGKGYRYQTQNVTKSTDYPGWLELTCQRCGGTSYVRESDPAWTREVLEYLSGKEGNHDRDPLYLAREGYEETEKHEVQDPQS